MQTHFKPWIQPRNVFEPLHPILALYANRNTKSKTLTKHPLLAKKGSRPTKQYPKTVVKMAKKSQMKKILDKEDISHLAKGHEHQEMLQPRPDLTIMVQPSKIDYAGWQNNGGVRFFIHRTYSVPLDPRDSIEIDNGVEAIIDVQHEDKDMLSGEYLRDLSCYRNISSRNLWHDLEVKHAEWWNYNLDACIHEWQAKTLLKACKCLPHYYSELFDYWYNTNYRCNHHGLKCMALVNGNLLLIKITILV